MSSEEAYSVQEQADNRWEVISPAGYVAMTCQDRHSANHYAELMNKAYRVGYKAGYRAGKRATLAAQISLAYLFIGQQAIAGIGQNDHTVFQHVPLVSQL
ncbi:MAG: hypothetical protein R3F37_05545 [Candidatus Competibacteraceae bacterium]